MKKLFILLLLLIIPMLGFTQNNLVFNRVLNFSLQFQEVVTVPEGKVWKMEWGIMSSSIQILSTNQPYGSDLTTLNSNPFAAQSKDEPIWLGEGSSIVRNTNDGQNMLSVLEFNVVPISSSSGGSGGGGVSSDGFAAIGIVALKFSDSTSGVSNHLMGTITVPEGEIWKITYASVIRENSTAFNSIYLDDLIWIGDYKFAPTDPKTNINIYLSAGNYNVRNFSAAGINDASGTQYNYRAAVNGIKYSSN